MFINLTDLGENKLAVIKEINGGHAVSKKLESMGIRIGKSIRKINGQKGPQIIKIDNLQIAIGYKMAKHVVLEVK